MAKSDNPITKLRRDVDTLRRNYTGAFTSANRAVYDGIEKLAEHELTAIKTHYEQAIASLKTLSQGGAPRELAAAQLQLLQDTIDRIMLNARESLTILEDTRSHINAEIRRNLEGSVGTAQDAGDQARIAADTAKTKTVAKARQKKTAAKAAATGAAETGQAKAGKAASTAKPKSSTTTTTAKKRTPRKKSTTSSAASTGAAKSSAAKNKTTTTRKASTSKKKAGSATKSATSGAATPASTTGKATTQKTGTATQRKRPATKASGAASKAAKTDRAKSSGSTDSSSNS